MLPALISLVLLPLPAAGNAPALDVDGLWRTVRHGAVVEIRDCGNATPCGGLVWVGEDVARGERTDRRNPDPAARPRPLIGLPVLWGFGREGDAWRGGRLYNPEDGKTFRASMVLLDPDRLRVEGCFGPFCRAQIWRRETAAPLSSHLSHPE